MAGILSSLQGAVGQGILWGIMVLGIYITFRLMDIAEKLAKTRSDTVCLGVGLHSGYGSAQRMYVKRGYVPDGTGVWYQNQICVPYGNCCNNDDLVLYLSKTLE